MKLRWMILPLAFLSGSALAEVRHFDCEVADVQQRNKEWLYIAYDDALDKVEVQLAAEKDGCIATRSCERRVYGKEMLADFVRLNSVLGEALRTVLETRQLDLDRHDLSLRTRRLVLGMGRSIDEVRQGRCEMRLDERQRRF